LLLNYTTSRKIVECDELANIENKKIGSLEEIICFEIFKQAIDFIRLKNILMTYRKIFFLWKYDIHSFSLRKY